MALATGPNKGKDCITYYRASGSWGTPTYAAITGIKDLDYGMSDVWAECTRRGSGAVKQFVKTLKEWAPTFEMQENFQDTVFVALLDAAIANTTIEFFLCSGTYTDAGNYYLRFEAQIEATKTEPIEGIAMWKLTIKPTYSTNVATWGKVA